MMPSDNPVRDAELYAAYQDDMEAACNYIHCDKCGEKIYGQTDYWEGDRYWLFGEDRICEKCLDRYIHEARHTLT